MFSLISFVLIGSFFCAELSVDKEALMEKNFKALNVKKMCVERYCIPRIIWEFWNSDDIPEDILEMMIVSRKSLVNFSFVLVSARNVSDLLDMDLFPKNYQEMGVVLKNNVVDLGLLEKYGGIYVDGSTYISSGEEMELFFDMAVKSKAELIGFEYKGTVTPVEFWGASENSSLMKRIRKEFYFSLLNPNEYINNTCSKLRRNKIFVPNWMCKEYDILGLALKKVVEDDKSLWKGIALYPKNRSHVVLLNDCKRKRKCFVKRYKNPKTREKYPFIKVYSRFRVSTHENDHRTFVHKG